MDTVSLTDILPILDDKPAVIAAVRQGFIAHNRKEITGPDPVALLFGASAEALFGDCHIKTAYGETQPYFCIKVATGFYKNPEKNLPVNNGLTLLFSAETGAPQILFQDQGYLTAARTAAAGALAAALADNTQPHILGIIGTGHQAELQARWISASCNINAITLWGRSLDKAHKLKHRLGDLDIDIQVIPTIPALCQMANLIVTATPSTAPLLMANYIEPGHHIIAMGSDSSGKIELDPALLQRADVVITDDRAQCLAHGEWGHAVRAGLVDKTTALDLGHILETPESVKLNNQTISIVDLTGLGAQDLAIASLVYQRLNRP